MRPSVLLSARAGCGPYRGGGRRGVVNVYFYLGNPPNRAEGYGPVKKTDILDFTARKLSPYILLFGMYVITHGHLSPGGGFQGGVVLASGLILLLLCKGKEEVENLFPARHLTILEALGFFLFLGAGLAGIAMGTYFLGAEVYPAETARWFGGAGFIFVMNIIIGLKVGAGISLICYYLLQE
jgi:multicomponent Na+:H+ antiporter subunit B